MNIKDLTTGITIEYLQSTDIGEAINAGIETLQKAEETVSAMTSGTEDPSLTLLKVASALSVGVFKNMAVSGKMPKDFSRDEWAGIADEVVDIAILADGQVYTEMVFTTYARLIDLSVENWKKFLAPEALAEVSQISDSIRGLSDNLEKGRISEPDYVERCLWLCLEAMVKLLAAYKVIGLKNEYGQLFRAIADLSVQYVRLTMYEKERDLLDEYLQNQKVLDEELQAKYDAYITELTSRSVEFDKLLDDAFSPDFQNTLKASVSFAEAAGVPKEQILDSQQKIDDYFS